MEVLACFRPGFWGGGGFGKSQNILARGRGIKKSQKSPYVIVERPLNSLEKLSSSTALATT